MTIRDLIDGSIQIQGEVVVVYWNDGNEIILYTHGNDCDQDWDLNSDWMDWEIGYMFYVQNLGIKIELIKED